MQKKKNEKGITMVILILTLIVMLLLTVPVALNFSNIKNINQLGLLKADMETLRQSIDIVCSENYKLNNIQHLEASDIGPLIPNSVLSTNSFNDTSTDKWYKNPNDGILTINGIRYSYLIIDAQKIVSRLPKGGRFLLNLGEINFYYKGKSASTQKYFYTNVTSIYNSSKDVYIMNIVSREIYYVKGVEGESGIIYHNLKSSGGTSKQTITSADTVMNNMND